MAAPNNLSLHSSFSSSQQQHSLQTPDTSTLFSSSPLPSHDNISRFNEDVSSLNSLEDLLSFSGITSDTNGPVKRHFDDDVELPDSKRIKHETLTSVTSAIPSILPTSKLNQPISSSTVNGGVVLPFIKPFNMPAASSSSSTGSNLFPQTSLLSHSNSIDSGTSTNAGSVALLVQLYKHFQSNGDSNGMAKVHQQLLALHSQLASKAGAYLSSLAGSSATNQFIGGLNSLPMSSSNTLLSTNNISSTTDHTNKATSTISTSLSNISTGKNFSFSGVFTSNELSNKPLVNSQSDLPSTSGIQSSTAVLNPLHIHVPTTTVQQLTQPSLGLSTANHLATPLTTTTSISRTLSNDLTPSSAPNQRSISSSLLTQSPLKTGVSQAQCKVSATSVDFGSNYTHNTSTTFPMSLPSMTTTNSPSIVTHSLPNSTTSTANLSSLSGLQVTAQTQANVLRAVYSYRIQRIQEFLNSLPPSQRPTTTHELKDLLIKNNILAKALPPDMIANLQQQVSLSTAATVSGVSSAPTTVSPITTAATITQSNVNPSVSNLSTLNLGQTSTSHTPFRQTPITGVGGQATVGQNAVGRQTGIGGHSTVGQTVITSNASTVTTSISSTSPGPLPGVTLETLRTLCRLPEADLVRIPMPAMLLTVVQYMRASKWNGSSVDLPNLIQKAQEALAKGKLTTASPQPPFQSSPTFSSAAKTSTQQQLKQPQSSISSTLQQQKPNNPSHGSPLSQYMASVGMKLPSSTVSTPAHKPTLSVAKPSLQQNSNAINSRVFPSKAIQDHAEKERLSALQKPSEEARIAFRFQVHLDKLHQQISSPELERPFSTWQDLILRLLPYHVYREPELPSGAMEKADAVYEGIAGVLLSRSQGLMNQYQQILLREEQRQNNDDSASVVLRRLWLEGEKERKEEEERQKREAEQIAAELSAVGTDSSSFLDSDPFMLNTDSYNDYPFLDQFWDEANDGLGSLNDFDLGIT